MNRLAQEKSPYLRQHAANPVDWFPWGKPALAEAARLHRPILLSIGYAACHWCHVMAHESFENADTAALMNRLFVNIKVDREERPDIDAIYMAALHGLGEQGGWPLTMFLTPDGTPFWGGTYFPPVPRWGRPSFAQLLTAVADAFARGDAAIATNGNALARALQAGAAATPGEALTPAQLRDVAAAYLGLVDGVHGGLRGAPKFPNAPIFRFLWQAGGERGRQAVHELLRHMCQGGIYDHLGGGFARYSTDTEWLVPHFEKMLYDNGQLLELLAFAAADRPDALYEARARETVGWMLRDMDEAGAFAASEDADSEGEEGKFYVWTAGEIAGLLGETAPLFAAFYDVTEAGNWEGQTILRRRADLADADTERVLARCRAVLLAAREQRPRPGRDGKVLADWNGLAIAALSRAAAVFECPEWLGRARDAYRRIASILRGPDGRFAHAWCDGEITARGLLDDQAAMALAALALHEATGEDAYLADCFDLVAVTQRVFGDEHGSFFITASDAEDVPLLRPRNALDNATPSGNGLMAEVFARLFHLTGDDTWREACLGVVQAFTGDASRIAPMTTLLAAARFLEEATVVVVAGNPPPPELLTAAQRAPEPAIVLRAAPGRDLAPGHPAHGKTAPGAYVCRGGVCSAAVTAPGELARVLRENSHTA